MTGRHGLSAKDSRPVLAVDWGTTAFRAALLDPAGQVLHEEASSDGILTKKPAEFAPFLEAVYGRLAENLNPLVLMSGMVGSANGWQVAPYCACPAGFGEVSSHLHWIDPGRVAIVPGLSCEHVHAPDVMRGEETQILGAMRLMGLSDGCFVLPGSHSKWAWVEGGRILRFKTLMTGEFFAALGQHTILAKTVDAGAPLDEAAFVQGVERARQPDGLLHQAFAARTLALFDRMGPAALGSYLSGLCIGEELRAMLGSAAHQEAQPPTPNLVLVGSAQLTQRYALALRQHGVRSRALGSESTWAGLHALARTL
jgi:2-dehydro-3-deoxygalactonokinase